MELERFCPSELNVAECDLTPLLHLEPQLMAQGIRFCTYADMPDTEESRRKLYALEIEMKADVPARQAEPGTPEPYAHWLQDLLQRDYSTLFLAEHDGEWVGITTLADWGFTGVRRSHRGRGLATALKVRMLRSAKEQGIATLITETHFDNAPMLAINRKLGYRFGTVEVAVIKQLD